MEKQKTKTTKAKEQEILFSSKKYHEFKKFHHAITRYAPEKICITDKNGKWVYANKKWYSYTGQNEEKELDDCFRDAIHHDDRKPTNDTIQKALVSKKQFKLNYRLKNKNGEFRWHQSKVEAVFNENQKFDGLIAFTTEIEDEKLTADGDQKNDFSYKTYAEAMPQMAFIADPEGNIIYYNQRWKDYVKKHDKTEGWGWKDERIHHPDDLNRTLKKWKHSLKTGEPYKIEYRLKRHDGKYRWHLGRAMPVYKENDKIKLWLGTITDIHKRKSNEEKLKTANTKLYNSNIKLNQLRQMRESLLHIIGHDLRGQTGNLELGLQLYQTIQEEEDKAEIYKGLQKMVSSQHKLVDGVTELLSIQNPKDVYAKKVNLGEIIHDIQQAYSLSLTKEDKINVDVKEVPVIHFVENFAYRILRNLISNAVKYKKDNEPAIIEIKSQHMDGFVLISVKDNGIGIDLEKHGDTIFKASKRLTDKSDGTGIGLYLVKSLVEGNGGHIEVESRPGAGTTFLCYLKEY